jgi:DNA replication protein DnaC
MRHIGMSKASAACATFNQGVIPPVRATSVWSLIITSQVPIHRWHDLIGVPTLADAILDRVVHNAYRIELSGESLRKPFLVLKATRARAG